jgi:hypothetical protein
VLLFNLLDISSVAAKAQTFLTMLPSTPHVKEAYLGGGGIREALESLPKDDVTATLCIDSTTLDVSAAQEVAASIKSVGASMVDAPVSGGMVPTLILRRVNKRFPRSCWCESRHTLVSRWRGGSCIRPSFSDSCHDG